RSRQASLLNRRMSGKRTTRGLPWMKRIARHLVPAVPAALCARDIAPRLSKQPSTYDSLRARRGASWRFREAASRLLPTPPSPNAQSSPVDRPCVVTGNQRHGVRRAERPPFLSQVPSEREMHFSQKEPGHTAASKHSPIVPAS